MLATFFTLALAIAGNGTAIASGLSVTGPSTIQRSGSYTYKADLHAFYQHYTWYTRYCGTASLSCTATWSYVRSVSLESGPDYYSKYLAVDCSGSRTKTFQVKVTASGFATPSETAYKVTNLCYDDGPL